MAVAGSVVHAYRCWLEDGKLRMIPTSMLRDMCEQPEIAILMIRSGLAAPSDAGSAPHAIAVGLGRWRVDLTFWTRKSVKQDHTQK